jgi:hypothetical protein
MNVCQDVLSGIVAVVCCVTNGVITQLILVLCDLWASANGLIGVAAELSAFSSTVLLLCGHVSCLHACC